MLHANLAPHDGRAVEVVHRQHGAALVLVRQERKALGLAGRLVASQVHVHELAVLGKHGQQVALGQAVVQAARKDVGAVLVAVVPGGLLKEPQLNLLPRDLLGVFYLRQRIHGWYWLC